MTIQIRKSRKLRVEKAYFRWLCSKIDRRGTESQYTKDLAEELSKKAFFALVPNDDNRALDGFKLREYFASETGFEDALDILNGPCSVLEMMVALAQHMAFQISRPQTDDPTAKCFWVMVKNLGLEMFTCDDPDISKKTRVNELILKKLLERTYTETGKGGLFPVRNPKEDQRQVEIWYQMMCYLDENYPI